MYRRNIETSLRKALDDTRVVLLHGARQVGKSTLAQSVAAERGGRYFTLDDAAILATARGDPAALVRGTKGLTVIDEVQKAPELFPAIKLEVDRDPRPGRFLLTGSAHVFLLPRLSESLAGRMEVLTLMPLGQDEMAGHASSLPDALYSEDAWEMRGARLDRVDICGRVIAGGYPEVVARASGARRSAWFRSYVSSLLERDVRDLANIEGLTDMPRLLGLSASSNRPRSISATRGLPPIWAARAMPSDSRPREPLRKMAWAHCSNHSSCRSCANSLLGAHSRRWPTTSARRPDARWTSCWRLRGGRWSGSR